MRRFGGADTGRERMKEMGGLMREGEERKSGNG